MYMYVKWTESTATDIRVLYPSNFEYPLYVLNSNSTITTSLFLGQISWRFDSLYTKYKYIVK